MVCENQGNIGFSVFGKVFDNDPFIVSQNRPGIVAMANLGKNKNAAQFYITLVAFFLISYSYFQANVAYLDKKLVAFGTVLEGMDVVYMMERCGSKKGITKWQRNSVFSSHLVEWSWLTAENFLSVFPSRRRTLAISFHPFCSKNDFELFVGIPKKRRIVCSSHFRAPCQYCFREYVGIGRWNF